MPGSVWARLSLMRYTNFLRDHPGVRDQLLWIDGDHPEGFLWLEDPDRKKDLETALATLEKGRVPVPETPPSLVFESQNGLYYSPADAWKMYVNHVAQSLFMEVNRLVPWSLADYGEEEMKLLFQGAYFMTYSEASGGSYKFHHTRDGGGRDGVTDWNAALNYRFLREQELIRNSPRETLFAVTDWIRLHLSHEFIPTDDEGTYRNEWERRYGYRGFPPLDRILHPPSGERYWIHGCMGTTSLYQSLLHSANIPVRKGTTRFESGRHIRPEFPTLGLLLAHGDDPYSTVNRPGINQVPTERLFLTFEEAERLVDNPSVEPYNGYTPTPAEQGGFNHILRTHREAFTVLADPLLKKRAQVIVNPGRIDPLTFDRFLTGQGWRPLFTEEERREMTETIDNYLRTLGEGDLMEGARALVARDLPYERALTVP